MIDISAHPLFTNISRKVQYLSARDNPLAKTLILSFRVNHYDAEDNPNTSLVNGIKEIKACNDTPVHRNTGEYLQKIMLEGGGEEYRTLNDELVETSLVMGEYDFFQEENLYQIFAVASQQELRELMVQRADNFQRFN